ncbi:hypothetical protein JW968_06650 [Candidatus Woesearchaeota archaeon]|nr:hypothetical protein [Candidatus Woesearchaeota archaeon]
MDIRNVQKTGNMFYIYLPTAWCKQHDISSESKLTLNVNNDGTILLSPTMGKKKERHIELKVDEDNQSVIHKLLVACYINPADSFQITLSKELDYKTLLDQKRLVAVEMVELDGRKIICESSISIDEPSSLLKTMVNKVRNLINVILKNYNEALIERYEEEIDRSRLLIDKSVINIFTFNKTSKLKPVDIHFISNMSRSLERFVDHLIVVDKSEKKLFMELKEIIETLKVLLDNFEKLNYTEAIGFLKKVDKTSVAQVKSIQDYHKRRIRGHLVNVAEILMDWAITKEIESQEDNINH